MQVLPTSYSFQSPAFNYFPSLLLLLYHLFFSFLQLIPHPSSSPSGLLFLLPSSATFFFLFSSSYSFPSFPLCSPFPSTHQSLALASPLRTYGMMDRRASGASKVKGHLPGALRCGGAPGPAMQPRPHTSVSRHSKTQRAHSNTYYRIVCLTLAPVTLIPPSLHVQGFVSLMIQKKDGKKESKKERVKMATYHMQFYL